MNQEQKRYGANSKEVSVFTLPLLVLPYTSLVLALYLFSFCFIPPTVSAGAGTTGGRTFLQPIDARLAAMGGVPGWRSENLASAVSANPALLGWLTHSEMAALYVRGLADTSYGFAGGSLPLEGWGGVVGSGVLSYSGGVFEENYFDGTSVSRAAQQDVMVAMVHARPLPFPFDLGQAVQLGVAGKWMTSTLLDEFSARAWAIDVGISCRFDGGRWGLQASGQHFGPGIKYSTVEDPLPTVWRAGGYGLFGLAEWLGPSESYLVVAAEVKATPTGEWRWGLGAEFRWPAILSIRSGYRSDGGIPSVGCGIPWGDFQLDYGVIFSSQPVHLVSLGLQWGAPAEWSPPVGTSSPVLVPPPQELIRSLEFLQLEIETIKKDLKVLKNVKPVEDKVSPLEKRLKWLEEGHRALKKSWESNRRSEKEGRPVPEAYTVEREGESLKEIAKRFYGQESMWESIFERNKANISDPHHLSEGQVVFLPERLP